MGRIFVILYQPKVQQPAHRFYKNIFHLPKTNISVYKRVIVTDINLTFDPFIEVFEYLITFN